LPDSSVVVVVAWVVVVSGTVVVVSTAVVEVSVEVVEVSGGVVVVVSPPSPLPHAAKTSDKTIRGVNRRMRPN
jgi:hypothetical protein